MTLSQIQHWREGGKGGGDASLTIFRGKHTGERFFQDSKEPVFSVSFDQDCRFHRRGEGDSPVGSRPHQSL